MTRSFALILLLLGGAFAATPASAAGGIEVEQVWARATSAAAKTAAIYLTISNAGTTPDRLTAASTPVADRAEPHETTMENGVMKMAPLGPLTIAPGETVVFAPEGKHIMLMGLKAPLKLGDKVPLTLTFEHAGAQQVTAVVEKAGAMSAGEGAPMSGMPDMH